VSIMRNTLECHTSLGCQLGGYQIETPLLPNSCYFPGRDPLKHREAI
jgi:hypothetical protein